MLSRYVGTWDVAAGPEGAPPATGTYTARWVLGERFGEITQTTTRSFAEDGIERWSTVNTDPSGHVISEMQGTNTRR